jgi:hypothetical protein
LSIFFFPEWADLGGISAKQRDIWEYEHARRVKFAEYFTGDIFNEKVPLEAGLDEEAPLLFPVGINLVRMLATAQADSLYGEWEEDIIRFRQRQDEAERKSTESAIKMLLTMLANNNASSTLWEAVLDGRLSDFLELVFLAFIRFGTPMIPTIYLSASLSLRSLGIRHVCFMVTMATKM